MITGTGVTSRADMSSPLDISFCPVHEPKPATILKAPF